MWQKLANEKYVALLLAYNVLDETLETFLLLIIKSDLIFRGY
jgi:hypothetical protein